MPLAIPEMLPQEIASVRSQVVSGAGTIERQLLQMVRHELYQLAPNSRDVLLRPETVEWTTSHQSCDFQMRVVYEEYSRQHAAHRVCLDETGQVAPHLLERSPDDQLIFLHRVMSTSRPRRKTLATEINEVYVEIVHGVMDSVL